MNISYLALCPHLNIEKQQSELTYFLLNVIASIDIDSLMESLYIIKREIYDENMSKHIT